MKYCERKIQTFEYNKFTYENHDEMRLHISIMNANGWDCKADYENLTCVFSKSYSCLERDLKNKFEGLNRYEIRNDYAVIFLDKKNGEEIPCKIDIEDLQKVLSVGFKWVPHVEARTGYIYATGKHSARFDKKRTHCILHRFITNAPKGSIVDHINHDTLDNRKSNLRVTTKYVNMQNRRTFNKNNTSGVRGVVWHHGKWEATYRFNGKIIYVGRYDDIEKAKVAIEKSMKENGIKLIS